MAGYYRPLTRLLIDNGFEFKRQAKGDHELWWNPASGRRVLVDRNTKSRSTANAVLKQAGLPKAL